jgi:hypothetical protein
VFTVTPFDLGLRPDGPLYVVIEVRCDASREWGWGKGQRAAGGVRVRRVVGQTGQCAVPPLLCVGPVVGGAQVVLQSDNAGVVVPVAEGALT